MNKTALVILLVMLICPSGHSAQSDMEFSLGVVVSHFENPLLESKTRNFLFPSVNFTYYGKRFFIDEEIGYTLWDYEDAVINLVGSLNLDFIYFLEHNENLTGIAERRLSFLGGLEALFFPLWGEFQVQVLQDLFGTNDGQELVFSYRAMTHLYKLDIVPKIGMHWKSRKLVQYYYGIGERDQTNFSNYTPGSGLNAFIAVEANYPVDYHWTVGGFIHYTRLAASIKRSPIVQKNNTFTAALGIKYVF